VRKQWSGRRVLITGHTGFKGAWLTSMLSGVGAEVAGLSLPAAEERGGVDSLWNELGLDIEEFRADIATSDWWPAVAEFQPEIVLHLAAQSLVSVGFEEPLATFSANVGGTANLLSAIAELPSVTAAVCVTTDKVYDTRQEPPFSEQHFLGGQDPYAASKAAAELVVSSWPQGDRRRWVTARAGNVIGGGDWAANRIIPDLVRAWSRNESVTLRRPDSIRPWQHVVEPLAGYLAYAEAVAGGCEVPPSLNFGPSVDGAVTVRELVEHAAVIWREFNGTAPEWRVVEAPSWEETGTLTLDARRSQEFLGIVHRWDWREAVSRTLAWYVAHRKGVSARALIESDLEAYDPESFHAP
jgi:CDP-glucose 4,6-dehydratase